ncbi:MAG: UMP kinase [Nitrososphaerota archaeon]|nr:UMP kinase [Candidatus Calditenuis fumarioli]
MVVPLTVKIGGHLFARNEVDVALLRAIADVIRECHDGRDRWAVVVGGGEPARAYIDAARKLGADEARCDEIAISVTRIHATLMLLALGELAYPEVVRDVGELRRALAVRPIAVTGGFWPGQSTFAVSALCAEATGSDRLIMATNVKGLYDRDPRVHPDARLIDETTYDEVMALLARTSHAAGEYRMIDSVGLSVLKRSGIRLLIVDGRSPESIRRAILYGEAGTVVRP